MSNKKEREKRREERLQEEAKAQSGDRRTKILQLGAGAVFLVIVAVVVLIIANSGGSSSGGDAENLQEVAAVDSLVNGVPQEKMTLGKPDAPVELIEYGDLQCPFCKAYSEEVLPQVIDNQVKSGKAKITFHNFTIIGEQSLPAGAATLAAGEQGRGWNYLELFYRNQGEENSGYVTDEFMEAVAKASGVKNIAQWNKERKSKAITDEVEATTAQAKSYGFTGTPSFAIKGPSTNGVELLGSPQTPEEFEKKIEEAS